MLVEGLVFALSLPATPAGFRRYLAEAVGLWARGERQAVAWAPHVANTSGLIDNGIDDIGRRRKVAVLGSGPLFDVPLEALARTFGTVLLVDRAHLSTTARRIGRYGNVQRLWHDLAAPGALDFLRADPELDWVISVNLLSQLAPGADQAEGRPIVDAHLDALAALRCPATLITDLDYRVVDRAGKVTEEFGLLHGRAMPPGELHWKWEVAPFGEESPDSRRVHSVAAWLDWRHAAAGPAK